MSTFLVSLLENFLGNCKKVNEYKGQAQFNCIECDDGRNKGNLEVNYKSGVYKCWACKDINGMHGSLFKLIRKFGSNDDLDTYKLIKPEFDSDGNDVTKVNFLELPPKLKELHNDVSDEAKKIKEYLYNRNISDEMISDYKMMYSTAKGYRMRVIIPSFDEDGNIEYYVSRAIYDIMSPKYRNPEYHKDNIIFFENRINWESDIYLVEGVFDAITIPNAIPMLGKYANNKLISSLMEKAKGNIIIILDGEDEALKDAITLYHNLNILNLTDRVKIVEIKNDYDLSEINKKFGKKGLLHVLNRAKKL